MYGRNPVKITESQSKQYRHENYKRETRPLDDKDLRSKQMTKKSFFEKYDRQIVYFFIGAIIVTIIILISRP